MKKIFLCFLVFILSLQIFYFPTEEKVHAAAPVARLVAGAVAGEVIDQATNDVAQKIVWSFVTSRESYDLKKQQKVLDGVNKRLSDYEKFIATPEGQTWLQDTKQYWVGSGWNPDDVTIPQTRQQLIEQATKTVVTDPLTGAKKVVIRGIGGLLFLDIIYDVYRTIDSAIQADMYYDAEETAVQKGTKMTSFPLPVKHGTVWGGHYDLGYLYYTHPWSYPSACGLPECSLAGNVPRGTVTDYFFDVTYFGRQTYYGVPVYGMNYITRYYTSLGKYEYQGPMTIYIPVDSTFLSSVNTLVSAPDLPIVPYDFPDETLFPDREKTQIPVPFVPSNYPDKIVEIPISPEPGVIQQPSPTTTREPSPTDSPDGLPDPNVQPDPDPNVQPDPDPDAQPDPDPDPDGTISPPSTSNPSPDLSVPDRDPNEDVNRWSQLVTTRFPFSLPWDLLTVVQAVNAPAKRPEFSIDHTVTIMGIDLPFKFSHDFAYIEPFMPFFRTLIIISFIVFLIFATARLFGGAK